LGQARFGIFLTLASTVDWFKNFDAGVGNGLRNKVSEAIADGKEELARGYVSTAYFILSIFMIAITILLIIANYIVPWTGWLKTDTVDESELRLLLTIILISFAVHFISSLVYQIFFALQQAGRVDVFKLIGKIVFMLLLIGITYISSDSLILYALVKTFTFAIIPLLVGLYYFNKGFKFYRPSLALVKRSLMKSLFSLGMMFFVIKVSMIVIFQTNNMLIAGFVAIEKVAEYQAVYKYMSIFLILFHVITAQLWGANTEAYRKGDLDWMKKSMNGVVMIWLASVILALGMVLISPFFYKVWLQDKMHVSTMLTAIVAISVLCTTWVNMYNLVLNGTGKIRLQMYGWILASLINIPISIFFAKGLDLGVLGIELGTIFSMIPLIIISPIQVKKVLSLTDIGLWSK
jgi:O-antigen/teichoic acid export membrane protein